MVCTNCKNKATKLYILENKILEVLNKWLVNYRLSLKDEKDNSKPENTLEHTLTNLNKELDTLEKQKERLHDFLEQGIYDNNTFGERLKILLSRIENAREAINKTNIDIEMQKERNTVKTQIVPQLEKILSEYTEEKEPYLKNILLKSVINYAVYKKEPNQKSDDFSLILYPNIPRD